MPAYKNTTTTLAFLGGNRIEPGETIQTYEWFTALPTGITKTSDLPSYNPVIYSNSFTSDNSVQLPDISGPFSVKLWVTTGEATVKFNTSLMSPALVIPAGEKFERFFENRGIDSIIFTFSGSSKMYVQIFKE